MKDGDKIYLCNVWMEFREYERDHTVLAWFDIITVGDKKVKKEYLYKKPTHEVEKLISENPKLYKPVSKKKEVVNG